MRLRDGGEDGFVWGTSNDSVRRFAVLVFTEVTQAEADFLQASVEQKP